MAALLGSRSIPQGADGAPVFPAPWAARAFALAVALNARGVFGWSEWTTTLGEQLSATPVQHTADPEHYWRAWVATLEAVLQRKRIAGSADLADLRDAWRRAAESTPHGQPVRLPP